MELNLTQCIKCNKCQDDENTIHPIDPDFFYSSGLCLGCFTQVVRDVQIQRKGQYCFGSDKECENPTCGYHKKCEQVKHQKE